MKKALMGVIGLVMAAAGFAEPAVSELTAKQRFPWNGWVDITCTVSGIPEGEEWVFSVTAVEKTSQTAVSTRNVRFDTTNGVRVVNQKVIGNGDYHLCWDAEKDLGKNQVGNYTLRVTAKPFVRERVQLWDGGVYWATTNVGADYPDESGDYFYWGDTNGCKRVGSSWVENRTGSTVQFNTSHCPTYNKEPYVLSGMGMTTKDFINGFLLTAKYDAATVNWGVDWKMPAKSDMQQLINQCDWVWTIENGVSGYRVSGKGGGMLGRAFFFPHTTYPP